MSKWTKERPTVKSYCSEWYWVKGGNFNRPVVIQVGVRSKLNKGDTVNPVSNDVWFSFPQYQEMLTVHELGDGFLNQFEWSPVIKPEEEHSGFKNEPELQEMLESLPREGSETARIAAPNAFVCKDEFGRVGIYPTSGGWLGAKMEHFAGDIAPFYG
jgi:hypothetical protein